MYGEDGADDMSMASPCSMFLLQLTPRTAMSGGVGRKAWQNGWELNLEISMCIRLTRSVSSRFAEKVTQQLYYLSKKVLLSELLKTAILHPTLVDASCKFSLDGYRAFGVRK
jgi:hypothetical protein